MEYTLNVPATRGQMGDSEFFSAVFPLGAVVKLFSYDPERMSGLSPEERTQRALKRTRIPEIASYVLGHREDYIFGSIVVSVDDMSRVEFEETEEGSDIGTLKLPLDLEFTVNDGQHRLAGIADALVQDKSLEGDNISVVIFPGTSRERSQQVFSDLNRTAEKTSRSLDILFDHRSPINRITVALADTVPLFRGRVDKERIALAGRSKEFTTLSNLQAATASLLNERLRPDMSQREIKAALDLATHYWTLLTELVEPWAAVADGSLTPDEARRTWISVYSLVLYALGSAGGTLVTKHPDDWQEAAGGLRRVNWRKDNAEWQGICMVGDEVVTRGPARRATADLLHWKLGLARRPRPVLPVQLDPPNNRVPSRRSRASN